MLVQEEPLYLPDPEQEDHKVCANKQGHKAAIPHQQTVLLRLVVPRRHVLVLQCRFCTDTGVSWLCFAEKGQHIQVTGTVDEAHTLGIWYFDKAL